MTYGPQSSRIDGAAIEAWWTVNARELPWRQTRDPWHVLLSEVMAQQTQVARVVPKWIQAIERYPRPEDMALAPISEVISLWVGLGFNRRARLLHECSRTLVDRHEGSVPDSLEALLALPGIGPYTARAVLAFAFEEPVAVVDTNVGRILARLVGRPLSPREVQQRADELVPAHRSWSWNQAILDFGALVCTKRGPHCDACPVRASCAWAGTGPDPAIGSAAVSTPQSAFEGSDRQGRGRLVAALRSGPIDTARIPSVMGWPDDERRAQRVLGGLVNDGLVHVNEGTVVFPE